MAVSKEQKDWEDKWVSGNPPWQKDHVDEELINHYSYLSNGQSKFSVFVSMCGKTLDIKWLAEKGLSVVGCDFVEKAAELFFTENEIPFKKCSVGDFIIYESTNDQLDIKFFVGDIYKCTPDVVGTFETIWDCNAFGAINHEDRERYVTLVSSLLKPHGRMLLCAYEYDQSQRNIPPHTISTDLVKSLFIPANFDVQLAETIDYTEIFLRRFNLTWTNRLIHYCTKQ